MTWGVDYAGVDGNRPPDFDAFKRAGGSFVWCRASFAYHDPSHGAWVLAHDPTFARDWAAMKGRFPRGAYMGPAVMASHGAAEQVAVFHDAVQTVGGLWNGADFPPCLDLEFPQGIAGTGMTRDAIMAWVRTAVAEIRRLFGCSPIIYTSGRVWNTSDADCLGDPPAPDLAECPLWLAHYRLQPRQPAALPPWAPPPPVPHPWGDEWHAHQTQGDALGVPGFTSTVDVDRFRGAEFGDHGGHVAWFQRKLNIKDDGAYGPQTEAAVQNFQRAHGLPTGPGMDLQTFIRAAWLP